MKTIMVVVLGTAILGCIYAVYPRSSEQKSTFVPTQGGVQGCLQDASGHWECVDPAVPLE